MKVMGLEEYTFHHTSSNTLLTLLVTVLSYKVLHLNAICLQFQKFIAQFFESVKFLLTSCCCNHMLKPISLSRKVSLVSPDHS